MIILLEKMRVLELHKTVSIVSKLSLSGKCGTNENILKLNVSYYERKYICNETEGN